MNKSQLFFSDIDRIAHLEFNEDVMRRAYKSLLDYLAVTCAGASFQLEKLQSYFATATPEDGKFKAIGTGRCLVMKEAVFLNGLNAHALDFDDGTNSGIIHLGAPIFSLLIPLAQKYDIAVADMVRSAIIGYETSYTLAVSIQPRHKALGFHATGTCGVIGATIAGAYLLGFTEEERYQAFATACVSSSGMLSVLDEGSELKPYNVAKASLLALTSLQLAKSRFKGHPDPLGGYRGFLKMMTGDESTAIKSTLLGGTYAIMKSYTKPYASCRYTHPSVEAAIHLRNKYGLLPASIQRVDIETYDLAVKGHDHTVVKGSYSAKMSIPYSTAVALIFGKAGLREFEDDILTRQEVMDIAGKTHVTPNKELSDLFPMRQCAIVTVTTSNGECYSKRVDYPKGEPENPLTELEFHERYVDLMAYGGINRTSSENIYNNVSQQVMKVNDLLKNL